MAHINVWYVVGKEDPQCYFKYTQVTPKDQWFNTWEQAEAEKIKLEAELGIPLYIFRRTCEVLHESKVFRPNSCA